MVYPNDVYYITVFYDEGIRNVGSFRHHTRDQNRLIATTKKAKEDLSRYLLLVLAGGWSNLPM